MSKRYRVYLTLSPDVLAALQYEASQSGLAPTTLAATKVYHSLQTTMASRAFQAHLRENREPQRAADANEERRLQARMDRAEQEQAWTQPEDTPAKRQRS